MTLIATFPARDGFVVCADTQETCPSFDLQGNTYELRKAVQKIKPERVGNYDIAIAGSGHAGLIDSFIVRAHRAVSSDQSAPSSIALRDVLESQLAVFYQNDVAICPDTDKGFKLFILFFCFDTKEYGVWESEQSVLRDVSGPELIGWEHQLYSGAAKKLFHPDMTIAQAVLAGLSILAIGEETINYIRGPFHVAVIRENGIWMEPPGYIAVMSERLRSYEEHINRLFLACADTEISPQQFEEVIDAFAEQATLLHKQHLDAAVQRMLVTGLDQVNRPYAGVPLGTMVRVFPGGGIEANYDVNARRIMGDIVRAQHGTAPSPLEDKN
jgi:hypothetical protein